MATTTQNTSRTIHLLALMKKGDDAFLLPPHDSPDVRASQDRATHAEAAAVTESGIRFWYTARKEKTAGKRAASGNSILGET